MLKVKILLASLMALASCSIIFQIPPECKSYPKADTIYFNGDIITMDDDQKQAAFLAVKAGKIVAVGKSLRSIGKLIGKHTSLVNLHGKTLLPGLIDSHSHFSTTAIRLAQGFDLSPPPFGNVTSIPQITQNIKDYIINNNIPAGKIIYGSGYSDLDLIEHRHPSRYDLDVASTINPICVRHFSGHIIACNSLALSMVDYNDSTPDPSGGSIDHFSNGTIYGVTRQWAMNPLLQLFETNFWNLTVKQIQAATQQYISSGVTTAHDMLDTYYIEPVVYNSLGDSLPLDIRGYAWITKDSLLNYYVSKNYQTNRFKVAGVKFILDGSIQGYTALLTSPYWVPQIDANSDLSNYTYNSSRSCLTQSCGLDDFADHTVLRSLFLELLQSGIDTLTHCNGDAAIDNMIQAVKWARNQSNTTYDTKFTIIHSQTIRQDQLDLLPQNNIHPSFFPGHLYFWGDKHYKQFLGPERANRMNPIKSAVNRNIKFTLHLDSPVIIIGKFQGINTFLQMIAAAVNRKTIGGRVLGEDQRVTAYEALKGLTINGAWQIRQQATKGSLQVGKLADLVILSNNPLKVRPEQISGLTVITTIKEGTIIYGNYPKDSNSNSAQIRTYADEMQNIQRIIDQETVDSQQFDSICYNSQ